MVDDILKTLEKRSGKIGAQELLTDVFTCGAIAISNRFDHRNAERREEQYLNIIKKHDKGTQALIIEIFTMIYELLTRQTYDNVRFNDYLGELYMRSNTSNSKAGQFFTPYSIAKLAAELCIDKAALNETMETDGVLRIDEPTCGSGGMIIAIVDILCSQYGFNFARNLLVTCSDIDIRCVHMAYLQLGLAGIPAVVMHQDTLTLETWDLWETPAYIMQWPRFKRIEAKHDG